MAIAELVTRYIEDTGLARARREGAAEYLGISTANLSHKLRQEGTNYAHIRERVRGRVSIRATGGDYQAMGFANPQNLRRWYNHQQAKVQASRMSDRQHRTVT